MSSSKNNKTWKEKILEDFLKDENLTEGSITKLHEKIYFLKSSNDVPIRRERKYERTICKRSKIDKSNNRSVPKKRENSDCSSSKYELLAEIDRYLKYLKSQRKYQTMGKGSCDYRLSSNNDERKKRDNSHEKYAGNSKSGDYETQFSVRDQKNPKLIDFLKLSHINRSQKSKMSAKSLKSISVEKICSFRSMSTNYSIHHKPSSESRKDLQNTEFRDNFSQERSHNSSRERSRENYISSRSRSNDYSLGRRQILYSKKDLKSRKRKNTFLGNHRGISKNDEQYNNLKGPQTSQTKSRHLSPSAYVPRPHQSPRCMYKPSKYSQSFEKQQNLPSKISNVNSSKFMNKTYIKSNSPTHRMYPNVSNNLSPASITIPNSKSIDDRTYTIPDSDENDDYIILPYIHIQHKTSGEYLCKFRKTTNILKSQDELAKAVVKLPVTLDDVDSVKSQITEMYARSFTLQSNQSIESNATISDGSDDEYINCLQLSQSPKMQTLQNFESSKPHPKKLITPNSKKNYHNDASDNPKSKYHLISNYKAKVSEKAPLTSELPNIYKHKGNNENLSISPQLRTFKLEKISSKSELNSYARPRPKSIKPISQVASIDEKERTRKKPSITPRSQPCNVGEMSLESCAHIDDSITKTPFRSQPCNVGQMSLESCAIAPSEGKPTPRSIKSDTQWHTDDSITKNPFRSQPCNVGQMSLESCAIAPSKGKPTARSIKSDTQPHIDDSITKNSSRSQPCNVGEMSLESCAHIDDSITKNPFRSQPCNVGEMSVKSCAIAPSEGKPTPRSIKSDTQWHTDDSITKSPSRSQPYNVGHISVESYAIAPSEGKPTPRSIKSDIQPHIDDSITKNPSSTFKNVYKNYTTEKNVPIYARLQSYNSGQMSSKSESCSIAERKHNPKSIKSDSHNVYRHDGTHENLSNSALASGGKPSPKSNKPKSQSPENVLITSKPYLKKNFVSSSQSFPKRRLGSPPPRQKDLPLQNDSNWETQSNTLLKQKNDQTISPKAYSRLDTLQSGQSISPRSFQSDLSNVQLQYENTLPVSGKHEASFKFERDVRPQSDKKSKEDRSETAFFIKDEENHDFYDLFRSKLNAKNDLHSEREMQSIAKTLFKNEFIGTGNYEDTSEKQRKPQIPESSKSCNNLMNGRHFIKSHSSTDCSNLLGTDEQSADEIAFKDETQGRDETKERNDTEHLHHRLKYGDEMVARQFAKYEPDRGESLDKSEITMIDKKIKTYSQQKENNSNIFLTKMEPRDWNDHQQHFKQDDFEESNFIFDDSERSCQFEEEDESTSYISDIPSFSGCDCMKEGYYKIMQLAYY